jgi:hypothetical protein
VHFLMFSVLKVTVLYSYGILRVFYHGRICIIVLEYSYRIVVQFSYSILGVFVWYSGRLRVQVT